MNEMRPTSIYIVGAQCTGKTTLVDALEASFDESLAVPRPIIIKEVARSILSTYGFKAHDITTSTERCSKLQTLIMKSQLDNEEAALKTSSWFISDRSGLDPIIYAQRHVNLQFAEQMLATKEWQQLRGILAQSLIFVCETNCAWLSDDGVRLMPLNGDDWKGYHEDFCNRLNALNLKYKVIPSSMFDLKERVSYVWYEWKAAMAEQFAIK